MDTFKKNLGNCQTLLDDVCHYGIRMVSFDSQKMAIQSSVNDTPNRETFWTKNRHKKWSREVRTHRRFSASTKKWEKGRNWHGEAFSL